MYKVFYYYYSYNIRYCYYYFKTNFKMYSINKGVDLESVVTRESGAISSSLSSLAQAPATASVPVIVRRCIEEVERRGLDIIGLYRLCGSASKKRILREAFERNPRTVDLSPDNVPDINVITGKCNKK